MAHEVRVYYSNIFHFKQKKSVSFKSVGIMVKIEKMRSVLKVEPLIPRPKERDHDATRNTQFWH